MMKARLILLIYLQFPLFFGSVAQVIESHSKREMNFAFEVKQIDEFFERFNNEGNSLFTSYLKIQFPNIIPDRVSLLRSLFDNASTSKLSPLVQEFCGQVTDSTNPAFLDFYSKDWYAEALCKFTLKGRPIDVVVLLKIQQSPNGGSKWMIAGVYSNHIAATDHNVNFPEKSTCCKFLNPMSHATNFISLSRAFSDKINLPDYLDSNFLHFPSSKAFTSALLKNQLTYHYVKEIKYHFLQVDGWIFTVNQYRRQSVHSGWLISSLLKVTDEEKENYRKALVEKKKR